LWHRAARILPGDVENAATAPAVGTRGAVVAPSHLATKAGLAILRAGGNAVDAAIATNAALSVVAAHSCGLGGDAFWLIWPGEGGPWRRVPPANGDVLGRLVGLNGSGRAGTLATVERLRADAYTEMPMWSPLSITVPGAVRSWADALERFGSLGLRELLEPAIDLADGFPSSAGWAAAIERAAGRFGTDGGWAQVFRPHGRPWRDDETVRLPSLAGTLRRLASAGPDDFYAGQTGARQAAFLASAGALIRREDLRDHASTWTKPIGAPYRDAFATSHPPNSSGVIALVALRTLEHFPPAPRHADADALHLAIEASRLALEDRERELTDPDRMAPDAVARLLDPAHAAALAGRIDPAMSGVGVRASAPRGGGTVFLATADRWGGVVSLIESNWHGFGSGVVDPQTGIAYQDRGVSFSLDPKHPNAIAPGKRTAHTLTPGMLFRDDRPWVAHGSMGGEVQPQIYLQMVSALVDRGSDVAEAVSAPRWGLQTRSILEPPEHLLIESRFPPRLLDDLRGRGHPVEVIDAYDARVGYAHAVEIRYHADGRPLEMLAATDPRSEGRPAVF
jgi:gamma-glutamyltranspeptidase/glutathione hydrolase